MYYDDTHQPPTKAQWDMWWKDAKFDTTLGYVRNPNFSDDYFHGLLRGWYRYSNQSTKDRIRVFGRWLKRNKSPRLSPSEWQSLRRQIEFSYT